jgi:hypothetical protein
MQSVDCRLFRSVVFCRYRLTEACHMLAAQRPLNDGSSNTTQATAVSWRVLKCRWTYGSCYHTQPVTFACYISGWHHGPSETKDGSLDTLVKEPVVPLGYNVPLPERHFFFVLVSGVPRGWFGGFKPPSPRNSEVLQSRTGLQIEWKMFSVLISIS